MKDEMLYLISGRNTYSDQLSRKFYEMKRCFSKIIKVRVLSGGDFQRKDRGSYHHLSQAEYHAKWYRRNEFFRSLAESYGELRSIKHNIQTYNYLKKEGESYKIIWERSTGLHCAGILYAKKKRITSILEWKDHLVKDYWSFFRPLVKWMECWKNKNADYIVVESYVLRDQLISEGVDAKKIFVAYNAVNPLEFVRNNSFREDIRKQFDISVEDIVVGYVGSYAFYHDSTRMIEAAKILKDKGCNRVKWLLVGDGKDKKKCEELALRYGLVGHSVFMVPNVPKEEVPHYLSAMDITILPGSTDIICPIKVMEYMAVESVVMVPDYACNREIVDGSTNGLLFKPNSEEDIAYTLENIVNDRERLEKMGKAARIFVSENLTWEKTYGEVLKAVIDKCDGR